jgi:predicted XRE-type DNA-binding protein
MKSSKKNKLEFKGWKVGSAEEFLNLSPEEAAFLEIKVRLSENLREQRRKKRITQMELAQILKSSQSRIAKMEAGDPSVSIDLLVRSLLAIGTPQNKVFRIIS